MRLSISRLRPLHLALATVACWIGLAVVKLGAAIALAWQVTRLPPGHGSITADLANFWRLKLLIARDGAPVWTGATSLGAIIGWAVGPPVLLALTWRWTREMEAERGSLETPAGLNPGSSATLSAGPPWQDRGIQQSSTRRSVELPRREGR
jgi:hypothetical protein